MIDLGLAAVANQSFSVQLAERFYDISLRTGNGGALASITRDGVALVTNTRITAGTPLLPYLYQEDGNFLMTTMNEEIPTFESFGVTQFLVYLTAAELAAYRAA